VCSYALTFKDEEDKAVPLNSIFLGDKVHYLIRHNPRNSFLASRIQTFLATFALAWLKPLGTPCSTWHQFKDSMGTCVYQMWRNGFFSVRKLHFSRNCQ
jgi:hypothetical protein